VLERRHVGAPDDHKIAIAPRIRRLANLRAHQFDVDHVLDADMMVRALGQELVLDFDPSEAGRLDHVDRAMQMHRIAPSARAVEDERKRANGADVDSDTHHLGQREVGFGDALDVAESAAAEINRRETCGLGEFGAQRIEHDRRFDERRALEHCSQLVHESRGSFKTDRAGPEVGRRVPI